MKQIDIVNFYETSKALAENINIPSDIQWDIYQLRKQLFPHIEFYKERKSLIENKYIDFADEKGTIKGEMAAEFLKEIKELNEMDKDVSDVNKITISVSSVSGLTAMLMEQLDTFINFTK